MGRKPKNYDLKFETEDFSLPVNGNLGRISSDARDEFAVSQVSHYSSEPNLENYVKLSTDNDVEVNADNLISHVSLTFKRHPHESSGVHSRIPHGDNTRQSRDSSSTRNYSDTQNAEQSFENEFISIQESTNSRLNFTSATSRCSASPQLSSSASLADRRISSFGSRYFTPVGADNGRGTQSSASVVHSARLASLSTSSQFHPLRESMKWAKLRKISSLLFSDTGKRDYGHATCLVVASTICVGTSRGLILNFDKSEALVNIMSGGCGLRTGEYGGISAIALSADGLIVAGGYESGHIFTWELSRSNKYLMHILPVKENGTVTSGNEGHLVGTAIIHIGFLNQRHTALVSADSKGMVFSHIATKGLGAIARMVKTSRILGKYSNSTEHNGRFLPILAFAPLTVEGKTNYMDSIGLTALLTPKLLVILTLTPSPETQLKRLRGHHTDSDELNLAGSLSWFPVGYKENGRKYLGGICECSAKLVYTWDKVVEILEVCVINWQSDKGRELVFERVSHWKSNEVIVAAQWVNKAVIAVLTGSQRLIMLEEKPLRVTGTFDMLNKHIYHRSLFRFRVQTGENDEWEREENRDSLFEGYYMSLQAYRGQLFFLGFNEVSCGAWYNWKDCLGRLTGKKDYINGIKLGLGYYEGNGDIQTVGLPRDDMSRQSMVKKRLIEIMRESLTDLLRVSRNWGEEEWREKQEKVEKVIQVYFEACLALDEMEFLFDDIFEMVEEGGFLQVYLEVLEIYILDRMISYIPATVSKRVIDLYATEEKGNRLERMVCRLDVRSLDIDKLTNKCKSLHLYDGLAYVWVRGMNDGVTALIEFLKIVERVMKDRKKSNGETYAEEAEYQFGMKMFPFLAYTLTGRYYPNGEEIGMNEAWDIKVKLYKFIFSSDSKGWRRGMNIGSTGLGDLGGEAYPYLRLILGFDAGSFLKVMNEAFEDGFFNEEDEGMERNGQGRGYDKNGRNEGIISRQYIMSVMSSVMEEGFSKQDRTYLYMFIGQNVAKFPQFLVLPEAKLNEVILRLCEYVDDSVREDCQISVEYLMSKYQPRNVEDIIEKLEEAKFFRVLRSIYKKLRRYSGLMETYFRGEEEKDGVIDCVYDMVKEMKSSNSLRQREEMVKAILDNAINLAEVDVERIVRVMGKEGGEDLLEAFYLRLQGHDRLCYRFLGEIFGRGMEEEEVEISERSEQKLRREYIKLLCIYDRDYTVEFLRNGGDWKGGYDGEMIKYMEEKGAIDAVVVMITKNGDEREAMEMISRRFDGYKAYVEGMDMEDDIDEMYEEVEKLVQVGIWVCERKGKREEKKSQDEELDYYEWNEEGWVKLLTNIMNLAYFVREKGRLKGGESGGLLRFGEGLRLMLRRGFGILLCSSMIMYCEDDEERARKVAREKVKGRVLRVLEGLVGNTNKRWTSLGDYRRILNDIFTEYSGELRIRGISNGFIEGDFHRVLEGNLRARNRGWRMKENGECGICRREVLSVDGGKSLWRMWREYQMEGRVREGEQGEKRVIFSCGDTYHERCLREKKGIKLNKMGNREGIECPNCSC